MVGEPGCSRLIADRRGKGERVDPAGDARTRDLSADKL
jgi:hypothetical protein